MRGRRDRLLLLLDQLHMPPAVLCARRLCLRESALERRHLLIVSCPLCLGPLPGVSALTRLRLELPEPLVSSLCIASHLA